MLVFIAPPLCCGAVITSNQLSFNFASVHPNSLFSESNPYLHCESDSRKWECLHYSERSDAWPLLFALCMFSHTSEAGIFSVICSERDRALLSLSKMCPTGLALNLSVSMINCSCMCLLLDQVCFHSFYKMNGWSHLKEISDTLYIF